MTCGHCANFHNTVLPGTQGKVHRHRQGALDHAASSRSTTCAAGASMLARCAGGDKTFPLIGALFHTQEDWAFVRRRPRCPELFKVGQQAGFTQESFDKCLADQKLLDDISAVRTRGTEQFGVNSTPTFFINGKKMDERPSVEEFDKAFGAAPQELKRARAACAGSSRASAPCCLAARGARCGLHGRGAADLSLRPRRPPRPRARRACRAARPPTRRASTPSTTAPPPTSAGREVIANPSLAEVMQPGELPEMALGRTDAPVTIVQYASMTCPYCRKFQVETFPVLKREYIDTGKVRYILRRVPDRQAVGARHHRAALRAAGQIFRALREADGAAGLLGQPGGAPRPHLQGGGTGGDDARAV